MAIRFLTGMPRNGKSYSAVKLILSELVKPDGRCVVTNVPLRLGAIYVYLRRRNVEDHFSRLVLLEGHIKPKEFYKYAPSREFQIDSVGNLTVVKQGKACVCVIDEANVFWPCRGFKDTTNTFLTYMQQHGHLGDDVWLVCHDAGQVDKALRYLAQEYWVSVNLALRRLWGLRGPKGKFVMNVYQGQPGLTSKPVETVPYTLNSEIADCYDTAAGVGISAGVADQAKDLRGRTPIWAIPALAALVLLVLGVMWAGPKALIAGVGAYFGSAKPVQKSKEERSTNTMAKTLSVQKVESGPLPSVVVPTVTNTAEPSKPLNQLWPAREPVAVQKVVEAQPVQQSQSVLANPAAGDSGWRWVVIRGFDGSVHAVRRYRVPSEPNTLRSLSSPLNQQSSEEDQLPRFPSEAELLNK